MIIIEDNLLPTYFYIPYDKIFIDNNSIEIKSLTNEKIFTGNTYTISADLLIYSSGNTDDRGRLVYINDYNQFFKNQLPNTRGGLFLMTINYTILDEFNSNPSYITYKEILNYKPINDNYNVLVDYSVYY